MQALIFLLSMMHGRFGKHFLDSFDYNGATLIFFKRLTS